jgi:hypothetical protein
LEQVLLDQVRCIGGIDQFAYLQAKTKSCLERAAGGAMDIR